MKYNFAIEGKFENGQRGRLWEGSNPHAGKTMAGMLMAGSQFISVCLHDKFGKSHFYLKRTPEGIVKESD